MSNKPEFYCYNVQPRKDKDPFWLRVGGVFPFETKDGRQGFNIPDLNLVILPPREDERPADTE